MACRFGDRKRGLVRARRLRRRWQDMRACWGGQRDAIFEVCFMDVPPNRQGQTEHATHMRSSSKAINENAVMTSS